MFGQHPNTNVIYLTKENRLLFKTLRHLQDQFNAPPDDNDKENRVLIQLSQILQNLPSLINLEHITISTNELDFVVFHEVNFTIWNKKIKIFLCIMICKKPHRQINLFEYKILYNIKKNKIKNKT